MRKSYVLIGLFLIFILFITIIGSVIVTGNVEIEKEKDILLVQSNKEVYFDLYGYSIDNPNVIVNPYGNSPLTAIVMFETKDYSEVEIVIKSKNGDSDIRYKFDNDKYHMIPVYGLYADYNNTVIIKSEGYEKIINIKTEKLPDDFIYVDNEVNDNFVFYNVNYPYAIDINGEVRWYLNSHYYGNISFLDNSNIIIGSDKYDNDGNAISFYRMDLLGKIYGEYLLEGGYYGYGCLYDNNLLVLSNELLLVDVQTGNVISRYINNDSYDYLNVEDGEIIVGKSDSFYKVIDNSLEEISYQKELDIHFFYDGVINYKIVTSSRFGRLGVTELNKKKIPLVSYDKIDKIDNIKVTKEVNRISVINNNDSKIYFILDKFMDKRIYEVEDVFYVNTTNLNGKYTIYYMINDKVYKTNYYVEV